MEEEPMPAPGALDGIRVVDFTQVMAGPFCTMLLGDLGADVIKVEEPNRGDQSRVSWGAGGDSADSGAFYALNRNKRSVTVDLKTSAGRAAVHRLVRTADVVVENFRPGVAARLGVGYEELRQVRPDLIYASISGFGQTGPYADRGGYDLVVQGQTGIMSIMGRAGESPIKSAIPIGDLGAGLVCAVAILAAVRAKEHGAGGQYIDTSLFEAALALSVWEATEFWATGRSPQPLGSANRMSAPYQALRAADGYLTVGANNDRLWSRLCEVIGCEELLADGRFATNTARMANREELVVSLERHLASVPAAEWVRRLLAAGVPAGEVLDYGAVLSGDPQVAAREMVLEMEHPEAGKVRTLGFPFKLSGTPASIRRPPPLLGADTEEILSELVGEESAGSPDGAH